MVNERVFQGMAEGCHAIGTWGHGFTYSGHPVPAAVAIETLKIYDEMDIGGHVEAGRRRICRRELRRRFADHPLVGEVRGIGLIARGRAGGRQGDASATSTRPQKVGGRLTKLGEENGVILRVHDQRQPRLLARR